jgi:hypothetical protein
MPPLPALCLRCCPSFRDTENLVLFFGLFLQTTTLPPLFYGYYIYHSLTMQRKDPEYLQHCSGCCVGIRNIDIVVPALESQ